MSLHDTKNGLCKCGRLHTPSDFDAISLNRRLEPVQPSVEGSNQDVPSGGNTRDNLKVENKVLIMSLQIEIEELRKLLDEALLLMPEYTPKASPWFAKVREYRLRYKL